MSITKNLPSLTWQSSAGSRKRISMDAMDSCQSVLSIFEPIYSSDGDELYLLDQIKDEHDAISRERDLIALENKHAYA